MGDERRSAPHAPSGPPVAVARRLAVPAGVLALAVGAVAYVGAVDPNQPGHYPTCPFLLLTGLQCPGCGSLRTLHALAHGDVGTALGLNVLTVAMVPVLAFFWARWAVARARGVPTRRKAGDPRAIWGLFAVVVVFWVVRNLPFGTFLAA
ncbi:DUF2752 domain-containing protein [Actinomadura namibiensis]|uniref:DUF2752 domain-containing protein n=1 Tax=Actinomadura namibiensis TaxID=182080 RepID=A0A7W3LVJ1_ACTNM|nr:DUF2752 domain-containing protein [Actinomadura namibiensis]MBA8955103.1 hypothetical protein [Actinomadura namibiensis]